MDIRKWALRGLKWAGVSMVALVLVLELLVQGQQWLLRWRSERLMADMHQIRLYESTWDDAHRLMHRWGRWGHYDGTCTAESCRYAITVEDAFHWSPTWARWAVQSGGWRIYNWLGGRFVLLTVSMTIQDGKVLRQTAGVSVTASLPLRASADESPLTLVVETKSRQRLRETMDDWWVMGGQEQLAQHPYYVAGRPGGCKPNCMEAVVTYSTRTPQAEIARLTAFNFSCFTSFRSCTRLEQLLPAAAEWRLYDEGGLAEQHAVAPLVAKECDIPVWAIARDAHYGLSVEVLSNSMKRRPVIVGEPSNEEFEVARVRLLENLKGLPPWRLGALVTANPYPGHLDDPYLPDMPEHLAVGRKYIVFPTGDDRKDQRLTSESEMELDRCTVWEDTPQVRREVAKGVAMNDDLRGPERW